MGNVVLTFVEQLWNKRLRQAWPAVAVVLTFAVLTIIVTWPLVMQLETSLAQNPHWSRDAYQSAYEIWWFKKALLDLGESPANLSWIYYPDGANYPLLLTYFFSYAEGVPFLYFLSPAGAYNVVFLDEWANYLASQLREDVNVYMFCHSPDNMIAPYLCRELHQRIATQVSIFPLPWDETDSTTFQQGRLF